MKTVLVAEDMRSAAEPCSAAHQANEDFTLDNSVGPISGVQTGCDYQFPGGFVIGTARDYDWTDDLTERRIC
jgi:hypothetical protein